jgi:glucosamine 6-phosphate synthetase-like amidotransferase/phosphosugar isomerase protein
MSDDPLEMTGRAAATSSQRPKVIMNFFGYEPPFDPVPIVERMVASVPPKYLAGLSQIVLTNSTGLSRRLRRSVTKARKRKVKIVEAGGLYHAAWHGNRAWIEIFVDNKLQTVEKVCGSRLTSYVNRHRQVLYSTKSGTTFMQQPTLSIETKKMLPTVGCGNSKGSIFGAGIPG